MAKKIIIAFFLTALLVTQVSAESRTVSQQRFLDKQVDKVEAVPFRMFWIKATDGSSYLASSNGRFVIKSPQIYDVQTGQTITSIEELNLAMKPDVNKFAVFYFSRAGKPTALLVVDPFCTHCHKMSREILRLVEAGKTLKYDLAVTFFPISRQAIGAICQLMKVGQEEAKSMYVRWVKTQDSSIWSNTECDSENRRKFLMLAAQLQSMSGIRATPTLILPDGTRVVGYTDPTSLLFEVTDGKQG